MISLVFAEYLNRLFWHSTSADVSPDSIPQWAIKLTAVCAILGVFAICSATPNAAPRMAVMFTTVKVRLCYPLLDSTPLTCHALGIGRSPGMFPASASVQRRADAPWQFSITVLGLVQLARGHASSALTSEPLFANPLSGGMQAGPSEVARALYSGLWAFDGWNQANYVGGEMRDAQRNIPRAIHCSMGGVIVSLPPSLTSGRLSAGADPVLSREFVVFRRAGEGACRSGS